MSQAEQLERETEQTRAAIADTLDELRACMTPGRVLDQLADRMSDGATAAFARNLKDQTVSNPLPVALIGTGLAWLMLTSRGTRSRSSLRDAVGEASETAETARELAGDVTETMQGHTTSAADAVQRGYETVTDAARRAASTVSDSTKAASQRTLQSGSALVDFCREQPLVLAGFGIALGAVMGALLPATETESQLMGEASDRVKDRAQELVSEQYESAKQAVEKVGARAADVTQDQAGKPAHQQDPKLGEEKADEPTLAPSGPDEWRGRPWPKQDEPL